MPISMYDAIVPAYINALETTTHLVGKAEAHCAEKGIAPATLIGTRLAPNMLDFAYQVKSTVVHSVRAIEGVRKGAFSPDMSEPAQSFDGMRKALADGIAALQAVTADEMESFIGKEMIFSIGDKLVVPYTGDEFLLHFSQPNLYFHVTAAYAIMRNQGVNIGKADYLTSIQKKRR